MVPMIILCLILLLLKIKNFDKKKNSHNYLLLNPIIVQQEKTQEATN